MLEAATWFRMQSLGFSSCCIALHHNRLTSNMVTLTSRDSIATILNIGPPTAERHLKKKIEDYLCGIINQLILKKN